MHDASAIKCIWTSAATAPICPSINRTENGAVHLADSGTLPGQGNIIGQYTQNTCGGKDCQFIVGFGNPAAANVKYCMAYSDRYNKCIPDGSIFKNGKPDVRPPPAKRDGNATQIGGMYLMKSGMKVAFGANLDIGTKTKHATPKNSTMLAWVDDNDEDEEHVEWDFLDDEVVEKLEE
ncbi:hypothetical protein SLS55_005033 [Diplodia seriata]|uniref:Uncharacterized protein n=1 Tax=Diplodia seriata TaxID=420778 RepID=A0ABR3CF78_9PEZI